MTLTFSQQQQEQLRRLDPNTKMQQILEQRSTSRTGRIDKQKMEMALSTLETEFERKSALEKI